VCINDLGDDLDHPQAVIDEVYRVLKPGGKVLAVMPARFDVDLWKAWSMPWRSWFKNTPVSGSLRRQRFTRRELRRFFARFVDYRVQKRHLRRSEVPHLWRWLPMSVLERMMGHFLIYRAFKPLSAAMSFQQAA